MSWTKNASYSIQAYLQHGRMNKNRTIQSYTGKKGAFMTFNPQDLAEEDFHFDLNCALRADGRFDTMRLIAASCRRPLSLLPELLRLGKRCRIASRTLGEFVADCRF